MAIKKDIISWNSMTSGYLNNYPFDETLSLFKVVVMKDGIELDSSL